MYLKVFKYKCIFQQWLFKHSHSVMRDMKTIISLTLLQTQIKLFNLLFSSNHVMHAHSCLLESIIVFSEIKK